MSEEKKLDVYLEEVHKQFIAIKDDDVSRAQGVFKSVFEQIKQKMSEQSNIFREYSGEVMYGGSVYDGTKTSKMDEFNTDIVVQLPINYEGIGMECDQPGFVRLMIVNASDNLEKQQEFEQCHNLTKDWRDTDEYLLQDQFRSWMHGVIQKALNEMNDRATVNGTTYLMKYKETGPTYTLYIRNDENDEEFKLDADLVPVITIRHPLWPMGYRATMKVRPSCREWLVVPKPNKAMSGADRSRCWTLSFQNQERDLLEDFHQLKMVLTLMKKLRTALKMKAIASYYIKTLFLWKVDKENKKFWQNSVSFLFGVMLQEFHDAIKQNNIPYFWNPKYNLIKSLMPAEQKLYTENLKKVLDSIQANDVDKTIFAFLEPDEIEQFKSSEMYQRHSMSPAAISNTSSQEQGNPQNSQTDDRQTVLPKSIVDKLDLLTQKLELQEKRLIKLEKAFELSRKRSQKSKLDKSEQVPEELEYRRNINCGVISGSHAPTFYA